MAADHRDRKVDALSPTGECGDQRFIGIIGIIGELDEIAQQRESFRVPSGNDPLEPIEGFLRDALGQWRRPRFGASLGLQGEDPRRPACRGP